MCGLYARERLLVQGRWVGEWSHDGRNGDDARSAEMKVTLKKRGLAIPLHPHSSHRHRTRFRSLRCHLLVCVLGLSLHSCAYTCLRRLQQYTHTHTRHRSVTDKARVSSPSPRRHRFCLAAAAFIPPRRPLYPRYLHVAFILSPLLSSPPIPS